MDDLTQEAKKSMVGLSIGIIQNKPPLTYLALIKFNSTEDSNEKAGKNIIEALLES